MLNYVICLINVTVKPNRLNKFLIVILFCLTDSKSQKSPLLLCSFSIVRDLSVNWKVLLTERVAYEVVMVNRWKKLKILNILIDLRSEEIQRMLMVECLSFEIQKHKKT